MNVGVCGRKENLPVLAGRCSNHMLVRGKIERALRVQSLVDVVETLAVRCKGKSAQVPAGEKVGETSSSFDFEQLEGPGPLSPFLYFIQEQSTVGRNTKWFYGGVLARSP